MPVTPITKTAKWRYDNHHGTVYLINPCGEEDAKILGKTLEIRLDKASKLVRRLNK